jgi:hypothetical protein
MARDLNAPTALVLIALAVFDWLGPKLGGASFMVVLGDERETALDAYVTAWKFISGDVWWRIFFISLVAAIPFVIVFFVMLRIAPPNSGLVWLSHVLDGVFGVLYGIFIDSAILRIVGTAPHLHGRYREAYQNSAQ